MKGTYLKCVACRREYAIDSKLLTCPEHDQHYSYLEVLYDYQNVSFRFDPKLPHLQRYQALLPFQSYGTDLMESRTPLMRLLRFGKSHGLNDLYVKDESRNPTGSFKDRHSLCITSMALERCEEQLFVVSSGNGAISLATYAKRAGLECLCILPKSPSPAKAEILSMLGAQIEHLGADFESAYRESFRSKFSGWNSTPGYNPFSEEGVKLIGFEIWEELGLPDCIVVPCGNGSLLVSLYKAFWELKTLGLIERLPKLIGVQCRGAAPLKLAHERGVDFVTLTDVPSSSADAVIAKESYTSPKVVRALNASRGRIIEVDEHEVHNALRNVAITEGLIPEFSAATAYAALGRLTREERSGKIVIVQTASGTKDLLRLATLSTTKVNSYEVRLVAQA